MCRATWQVLLGVEPMQGNAGSHAASILCNKRYGKPVKSSDFLNRLTGFIWTNISIDQARQIPVLTSMGVRFSIQRFDSLFRGLVLQALWDIMLLPKTSFSHG